MRIAVNLSVEQFRNTHLTDQVAGVLEETGLPPKYLELEITESVALHETDYIIGVLKDLKSLGVSISIDDFGSEYSSLSRLKQMPVDRIKIDKQFIQGISLSADDEAVTDIILDLSRALNLSVIAEGVESNAQLEYLSQRKCDEVQGFYFFKPLSAEELERLLKSEEG